MHLDVRVSCELLPRPRMLSRADLAVALSLYTVDAPAPSRSTAYQRDGFLVVPQFMPPRRARGRARALRARVRARVGDGTRRPDEVNYTPGVTPPDRTRQLCNVWKADRTLARTTLSRRNGAFAAALAGAPGMRLLQDNAIWKPPSGQGAARPPGRGVHRLALAEEHDDVLDRARRHGGRHGHDLLRARLAPLAHCASRRPVPRPGRLARLPPRGRARGHRGRGGADRGAGRRRRVPRRLDLARLAAQRAGRRGAPLDHLAPRHDRAPCGATMARRTPCTAATAGRASASSTRRSSRWSGGPTATEAP